MEARKCYLVSVICLYLGFMATISLAQPLRDGLSAENLGAEAKLVVTSISGPASAILNQNMSVTYRVKNNGDMTSGAYEVRLYLSVDNTADAVGNRLLKIVKFGTGLAPGESRLKTTKVKVPINGLSGDYYLTAMVAGRFKASAEKVSIIRYTLGDNNETVTDHKTGLVWQQSDNGQVIVWDAAASYCKNLVLGGKTDWRLPRMDELLTIVDYSRYSPAVNPMFECESYSYWSSTEFVFNPAYAWHVVFYSGYVDSYLKTNGDGVRCVRGIAW